METLEQESYSPVIKVFTVNDCWYICIYILSKKYVSNFTLKYLLLFVEGWYNYVFWSVDGLLKFIEKVEYSD